MLILRDFKLHGGTRPIRFADRQGRQRCEVAAFTGGREDLAALGLRPATESPGINDLLAGAGDDARTVGAALRRRGLSGRVDRAARVFDGDSRPGETVRLTAERDCIAIFHASGGPMAVDAQDPPTDLSVIVERAALPNIVALLAPLRYAAAALPAGTHVSAPVPLVQKSKLKIAALLGPDSLAEVPLSAEIDGTLITGQVDRLAIGPERIVMLDYKTGTAVPATLAEVPPAYAAQMAAYRAVLARAFPGRKIACALAFTDGPVVHWLPDSVLDAFAP